MRTGVLSRDVGPDGDVVLGPLEADLEVVVLGVDLVNVLEDRIALILVELDDALREPVAESARASGEEGSKRTLDSRRGPSSP